MNKFTEDANAIYSEIVSAVLSFVSNKDILEKVYVLGEIDSGYSSTYLYLISGKALTTKQTAEFLGYGQREYFDRIGSIMDKTNDELGKLQKLFQEVGQEVPKGVRLEYNIKGAFSAKLSYESVTTDEIGMHDAIHAWQAELNAALVEDSRNLIL
jgi:hypothetical protein